MRFQFFASSTLIGLVLFWSNGCQQKTSSHTDRFHEHSHEHLEEGPHGGHIIEIGAKEAHAELVHDEATNKVGVHILDGQAKASKPIETKMVLINVAEDGAASQYELPAVPQSGESDGMTSYFEIVSEPLCKVVLGESAAKSVQARVSIQIGERPYVGLIDTAPHDHDHAHGHDGEHADEGEHKEEHAEEHKDEPAVEPKAEPAEAASAEPAEAPQAEPAQEPQTEPAEEPQAEPAQEPAADTVEQPTTELTDEPAAEKPADEGAEK
jgi:hypothetical protein